MSRRAHERLRPRHRTAGPPRLPAAARRLAASCILEWDWPHDETLIDGFDFEVNGRRRAKVARAKRQVNCRALKLAEGANVVRVYAYRGANSSGPSNALELEWTYRRAPSATNPTGGPPIEPPVILRISPESI